MTKNGIEMSTTLSLLKKIEDGLAVQMRSRKESELKSGSRKERTVSLESIMIKEGIPISFSRESIMISPLDFILMDVANDTNTHRFFRILLLVFLVFLFSCCVGGYDPAVSIISRQKERKILFWILL